MRTWRTVSCALLVAGCTALTGASEAVEAPTRSQWLSDVSAAMSGSGPALNQRVASRTDTERLAINLDIDNTSIGAYYDRGKAVVAVREYAQSAAAQGVAVMFNTGRLESSATLTRRQLTNNGFPITRICYRRAGEGGAAGKNRCRRSFVGAGYTIVSNVGNRPTDFMGEENFEQAYKLPDYDGLLG